jgi:hypothetical protein
MVDDAAANFSNGATKLLPVIEAVCPKKKARLAHAFPSKIGAWPFLRPT